MSVYEQAYATPSRVLGAYRFLLRSKGQRVDRRELEEMLMPEHLPLKDAPPDDEENEGDKKDTPKREMARRSIDEGLAMKLLAEDGGDVLLHPDLSLEARSADVAETIAPRTMGSLVMAATHTANHDLARAIAWYLGQDVYAAPTSWQDVDQKYLSDAKKLEMTNSRFGQLLHWSRFLGFAWAHAVPEKSGQKGSRLGLTPDPYRQILWSLENVFVGRESEVLPLAGVVTALSTMVPVLEGGSFRNELETSLLPPREPHQLSSSTAHAWLRLHEEGVVRLDYRSDGTAYVFPDGDGEKTYTEVSWQRPSADVMQ